MKLFSVLGFVALTSLAACSESTTTTVAAVTSVNGVLPAQAFLGRTTTIQISGDNTTWDKVAAADLAFGDGITVKSVVNASPTALLVTVDVAKTAATGARDITVAGKTFKGFEVIAPVTVTAEGTAAQGSVVVGKLKNLDIENPFDPDTLEAADLGAGYNISLGTPGNFSGSFTLFADVTAPAGDQKVALANGDGTAYATDKAVTFTARTASAFNLASPTAVTFNTAFESSLATFDVPANSVVDLSVTAGSAYAPAFAILPESGKWADQVGSFSDAATVSNLTTSTKKFYIVFLDTSGAKGYSLTPKAKSTTFTSFESESNNTAATANALTLPSDMLANIENAAVIDWFKVTIPAGADKAITVKTVGVDSVVVDGLFGPSTVIADTVVTVYKADGTSVIATSSDKSYDESVTTTAQPAGDYLVKVTQSPDGSYTPGATHYRVQASIQ